MLSSTSAARRSASSSTIPRPSWATTFVRRALEADARFQVAALSFTSRGISRADRRCGSARPIRASTPSTSSSSAVSIACRPADVRCARSLHARARRRGRRRCRINASTPGRARSGRWRASACRLQLDCERLLEQPAKLTVTPPARARSRHPSCWCCARLPPATEVVARLPGADGLRAGDRRPMPRGDGRLLLSGAMDAWRFRAADNGAFDRFWQSTIAGLALAVPPPIAIGVDPPLLRPGERGDRDCSRALARRAGVQRIARRISRFACCPDPEAGVYRGRFEARERARADRLIEVARRGRGQRLGIAHAARASPTSSASARPPLRRSRCWRRRIAASTSRRIASPISERFLRGAVSAPSRAARASPDAIGLVDVAVRAVSVRGMVAAPAPGTSVGRLDDWVIW